MNKQKLIAHFQEQKEIIEKEIAFWQSQPDTEAEKPELRHGDFGISKAGLPWLAVQTMTDRVKVEVFWWDSADPSHLSNNDFVDSRFGNIFDLMKDWGEDLEEFTYAGVHFEMKGRVLEISIHDELMTITGLESQIEAWRNLGQMIMTLKRNKQGD